MSKVQLAKIKSLTFYKDEDTAARRTDPLPQLVCVGKPCKYYQPEVVRCANVGGTGSEVEWKVGRQSTLKLAAETDEQIVRSRLARFVEVRSG